MTARASALPVVSVVMANRNAGPFIGQAVRSVLDQSLADLELILADDASSDDSIARAQEAAGGDPRLKVVRLDYPRGPGGARNRALALARGRWIAVVDSDDLIAPDRLERLTACGEARDADIAADNLALFMEDRELGPFLQGRLWRKPREVRLAEFALSNRPYAGPAALGFLKPVFRRATLQRLGVAYDESLRVGEDFDLVARLLAAGARYWVDPVPLYRYRKHPQSTSHRLRRADLEALLAADDRFRRVHDRLAPDERAALVRRRRSLSRAVAYDGLIAALKARSAPRAIGCAVAHPSAASLLIQPLRERITRLCGDAAGFLRTAVNNSGPQLINRSTKQSAAERGGAPQPWGLE